MKNSFLYTVTLITLTILLHGCTRLHFPERENLLELNSDATNLNGNFNNLPADTTRLSMWNLFVIRSRKKVNPRYSYSGSYVQLVANSNHRLTAKLFVDSSLEAQIRFKGKLKGNYFSVKRKIKYFGVPFIFGAYSDTKMQLAKDIDGRLYIDQAYGSLGWAFILAAGASDKGNYVYDPK